jgi:hypothetical protein
VIILRIQILKVRHSVINLERSMLMGAVDSGVLRRLKGIMISSYGSFKVITKSILTLTSNVELSWMMGQS